MGAAFDLPFSCTCETLRGTLTGVSPRNGNRTECFCHDCRAAGVFAGHPDPAPGPVGLYQTTPDRVRLDAGADQLTVFSFSKTGLLRWQAKCCGAPLFNTLRRPRIAFAAILTDRLQDDRPLGPVKTRAFVRKANGKRGHDGLAASLLSFVTNALPAAITGRWKQTPFFDVETGQPVRPVHVISADERTALDLI